jgi:hypothetical protein
MLKHTEYLCRMAVQNSGLDRWFAVCDEVIKNGRAADRRALRKQIGGMQAWCYRW